MRRSGSTSLPRALARPRGRRGAAVLMALAIVTVTAAAFGGWSERAGGDRVRAQAPAPAVITLNTRFLEWSASPGERVEASLRRRGREIAATGSTADTSGRVSFALNGIGGTLATVQPGDTVSLRKAGASPLDIAVLDLVAGVDAAADTVVGHAPPGASIDVAMEAAGGAGAPVGRTVAAGPDGRFEARFAGALDIGPESRGVVHATSADGHVMRAIVRGAALLVTLGWPEIEVRSTPGEGLSAAVSGPGKRLAGGSPAVAGADPYGSGATLETVDRGIITLRDPVVAGDTLTVTRMSAALPVHSVTLAVPDVSVTIDGARRRVIGAAPAGGAIGIELRGPDGETHHVSGTVGADGRFEVSAPEAPMGPGWQAAATWDGGDGLRVRAIGVMTRLSLALHTPRVSGIARPFSDVSIVRFGADGERSGPWRATVDRDGRFTALLLGVAEGRTISHRLAPGDVVQFDLAEGDPIPVQVPEMTARADADAEVVEGEAPPGAALLATVSGGVDAPPAAEAAGGADAAGRYRIAFGDGTDIEPPAAGAVILVRPDGHRIELAWSAVSMRAEIGGARIQGNAAPEREVEVVARDVAGTVLARARTRAVTPAEDGVRFTLVLTDALGAPIALAPGDRLSAIVGDHSTEFEIPPLDGVIHVADDLVAGGTTPDTRVAIVVSGPTGASARREVAADAAGSFAYAFGGEFDIRYNDRVELGAAVGRNVAWRDVRAPGLTLDLAAASVSGWIEPAVAAEIELHREGAVAGRARTFTRADATFSATIRDSAGHVVPPRTADVLVVSAPLAGAERRIEMDVPELSISVDPAADRVSGTGAPGGALELSIEHAFADGSLEATPAISADGRWDAGALGALDIAAGARATARMRLPSGHLARRTAVLPVLSIAHGLDLVCGQADPHAPISLTASEPGGAEIGHAATAADAFGTFSARLVGSGGRRVELADGVRLRAVIGSEARSVEVGAFTAELDSVREVVAGSAPAGAEVALVAPLEAADCRGRAAGHVDRPAARRVVADAEGGFAFALRGDIGASRAEGLEVAYSTADGHHVFLPVRGVQAELHVYRARVEGLAAPRAELAVRLVGGGDETLATGAAVAGPDGSFALTLLDGEGAPAEILPGQVVEIVSTALSDHAERIRAEHLVFDIGDAGAIAGSSLPGRAVELALSLVDGRRIETVRTADDDGIWGFGPADVPARAGWGLADVALVRARVEVSGRHAMVAEAVLVDPVGSGRRIYLPRGER